jgi:far upstream element-binding protein
MIRVQVPIPISKVGLVIGRGGETIRELQTRSGCKVMVLPEEDTVKQERFVQIQGPQQAVDIAKGMVTDVVNNVYYQAQSVNAYGQPVATLNVSCTLTIPNNTVGLVIGRGGETIKNLQQVSRAKIQIEQNSPEDAPEDRLIHLSGNL